MSETQAFWTAMIFLIISLIQITSSTSIGFTMKIIPITSPESPFYIGNLSESEKTVHQLVEMSKIRALSFSLQENIRLPVSYSGVYLVKIQIGTPSIPVFLLMDTGSGLTWTQCQPCVNCYPQMPPVYDSRTSRTYQQLPCDHPVCRGNPSLFRCMNRRCVYSENYADGSSTRGIASQESFGFLPNTTSVSISFGCSNDNRGFTFAPNSRISGVLGLSTGPESLVRQLGQLINNRFSYCLLRLDQGPTATSYLRFGQDIGTRGRNLQSTPIVTPPGLNHYYLSLSDISVNGRRLGFPPGTFSLRRNGTGGCIIDSGTTITSIQENAYQTIIGAFASYFSGFRLQRYYGQRNFELCYLKTSSFRSYPTMTYHFQGANFTMISEYVNVIYNRAGYFCVTLLPNRYQKTIIGAWHQQNTRFIYDLNRGVLQFAPENCMRDAI
ncbi:hypothetical protein ACOSQ3_031217 [Xanthoceras sorbifolium]